MVHYALAEAETFDEVDLAEIVGALSHALDLTEGQSDGHCKRTCWIALHIGEQYGLDEAELSDLFYASLLKDLGSSSNAARISKLYLTDDIAFKQDFKKLDGSLGSALRFVIEQSGVHSGIRSGLGARVDALAKVLQSGGEIAGDMFNIRSVRGAELAGKMRFNKNVQSAILSLDEHFDGSGKPHGLAGGEIPILSQITLLAQVIDIFYQSGRIEAVRNELEHRRSSWFDPGLIDLCYSVFEDTYFWKVLTDRALDLCLYTKMPARMNVSVSKAHIDEIASVFAEVVDAKSPFTAGHCDRVMLYCDLIAGEMRLSSDHRRRLRHTALLHDIGKLAVSNSVLDKAGKLHDDDWSAIRSHPKHSRKILERVLVFRDLAPIAGAHHERLDGQGYPDGLKGDQICMEARILTVADVFDALSADRPHRKAMPLDKVLAVMEEDVGKAFDPDCFMALKNVLGRLDMAEAA